mmetsp:Transcript_27470/g.69859  ORF Transcript_27470/g.69859 Transcript_27470/m.69859 type:complete len:215 (-) Transcript_27470:1155-1799(-)
MLAHAHLPVLPVPCTSSCTCTTRCIPTVAAATPRCTLGRRERGRACSGDGRQNLGLELRAAAAHVPVAVCGHDQSQVAADKVQAHALELLRMVLLRQRERGGHSVYVHALTQPPLTDAPQPCELVLVGCHQQVLRHVRVQLAVAAAGSRVGGGYRVRGAGPAACARCGCGRVRARSCRQVLRQRVCVHKVQQDAEHWRLDVLDHHAPLVALTHG